MKFGIRGQLTDVITRVKFLVNRFKGYGVLTPENCPFPLTCWLRHPYNSVRTAVRHCYFVTLAALAEVCALLRSTECHSSFLFVSMRQPDLNATC